MGVKSWLSDLSGDQKRALVSYRQQFIASRGVTKGWRQQLRADWEGSSYSYPVGEG